jgi:putative ABC transport system permease protein
MGLKDPVGKQFTLNNTKGIIASIVQDFHFKDAPKNRPLCHALETTMDRPALCKNNRLGYPDAIAAVKKIWKVYSPEYPFEYNFLDDAYNKMYSTGQRTGSSYKCSPLLLFLFPAWVFLDW